MKHRYNWPLFIVVFCLAAAGCFLFWYCQQDLWQNFIAADDDYAFVDNQELVKSFLPNLPVIPAQVSASYIFINVTPFLFALISCLMMVIFFSLLLIKAATKRGPPAFLLGSC